jgi:hypothetical protein
LTFWFDGLVTLWSGARRFNSSSAAASRTLNLLEPKLRLRLYRCLLLHVSVPEPTSYPSLKTSILPAFLLLSVLNTIHVPPFHLSHSGRGDATPNYYLFSLYHLVCLRTFLSTMSDCKAIVEVEAELVKMRATVAQLQCQVEKQRNTQDPGMLDNSSCSSRINWG